MVSKRTQIFDFRQEIKHILSTNGDSLEPFEETIELLNILLIYELMTLINKYDEVIINYNKTTFYTILEIFDGSIVQKSRFLKWLNNSFMTQSIQSISGGFMKNVNKSNLAKMFQKHKEECQKLLCIGDDLFADRLKRLDKISQYLNTSQYLTFKDMQLKNFRYNKTKMKEFVVAILSLETDSKQKKIKTKLPEIVGQDDLIELMCYVARETILCIIDAVYEQSKSPDQSNDHKTSFLSKKRNQVLRDHMQKNNTTDNENSVDIGDNNIDSHDILNNNKNSFVLPPYYHKMGIMINDINMAIGHFYTTTLIAEFKENFPQVPYFSFTKSNLVDRDLLVNELTKN